jgi:hypothetical protein
MPVQSRRLHSEMARQHPQTEAVQTFLAQHGEGRLDDGGPVELSGFPGRELVCAWQINTVNWNPLMMSNPLPVSKTAGTR